MKKSLTIAGSDSGGGAGIQADLKTMTVHKIYGASVITALTAQNTLGVQGISVVDAAFVEKQFDSVFKDIKFDSAKTGMLAAKEIVELTADKIKEYGQKNLVVDPVMVATSGDLLLEKSAVKAYKEKLFPLARVVTPNLNEAKVLCDMDLNSEADLEAMAEEIYGYGSEYVLIKGGHRNQKNSDLLEARDLLYDGKNFMSINGEYIATNNTHGTGCTLSAAIASNLALGFGVEKAIKKSKKYITDAIKAGTKVGSGNNPVNHFALWSDIN
ncbi:MULTISPECIES: bifunctional hydroxymethylpyrimidine kinase/phosphomethylpyrimidine kinase [unclassified Halanaerobium]|uniref:bifunctional hydroxymethylpyrimidine kinase/phosphomethylpyrimidine kinase n=1 Tax=unclassified Halanaerobium TaxID=2641197 RepID=UPI000DF3532A|nr:MULTISPECIES: bifunctional hydroxymethylpyrimidine kinase/phosphomethylpyrimidine kinase [unclassified Halanaerobium]RCW50760.1 hydroxymethylpyrimidine/phosphomethylpyrimidine kinase [Halanaerobium sp. MA284_MarDTE_T2]RCW78002.1 hydroxymethylpyrimidine/phosphomethylpyrimidine kinase [Halanaerobium sp. DL-01]